MPELIIYTLKPQAALSPSLEAKGQSGGSGENVRVPGYRLSPDYFQTIQRVLTPDWAQKNALYYFAQWANRGSYFLFVCSYTTAIIWRYLSGSFTKVGRVRGFLAFPTLPLPETEELPMIWEDVSDANDRTVPICS